MALAFSRIVGPEVVGTRRHVVVEVTFDNSYPTNGEAITANDLGLGRIDSLVPVSSTNVVEWDATNSKLVVYASGGGGDTGVVSAVIAGGATGNHTVTGITTADTLLSVVRLDRDSTAANINISDLTGEFTIDSANTIDNDSGTTTTGDALLILYGNASAASTGDVPLAEVPNTTDLQNLVVTCHAMGY